MDKFVLVFLDGILIYYKNEEEHEEHLRMALQLIREHKLYAKLSKCEFYKDKIHYLDHIILDEGISVDPENIDAIMNWPTPRNVTCSIPDPSTGEEDTTLHQTSGHLAP